VRAAREETEASRAAYEAGLAAEKAKLPIAPPTYRNMDQYLSQFPAFSPLGEAELRVAARTLGVDFGRLVEAARGRGLQVIMGVPRPRR
jgi:hypothetical protein